MRVTVNGRLPFGVSAKDLALAIIARVGIGGGTGHVVEFAGEAVRALSMEGRMTLCNMSIEMGAKAGMVAPDATTVEWLRGRPRVPAVFEAAAKRWLKLASDGGAVFDREVAIDGAAVAPMVTWGSTPDQAVAVNGHRAKAPATDTAARAVEYMKLAPGAPIAGQPVDVVFVGSCTNGRLEDLRAAAAVLQAAALGGAQACGCW